jgi:heme exporter protein A
MRAPIHLPVHLSVTGLACQRGHRRLFSGLSFSLAAGAAILVKGPNGSGKSSLLRLLAKLGEPESGTISHAAPAHFLGHANGLKPTLTVLENLTYWESVSGMAIRSDILSSLGVSALLDMQVRCLSQGQQRRVALARIFSARSGVWILDEPTAGLDDTTVLAVGQIMRAHLSGDGSIIAATHTDIGLEKARTLELRP